MTSALTQYDYSKISNKDDRGKLMSLGVEVQRGFVKTIQGILDAGQAFNTAHNLLSGTGRDGEFGPWVKSLGISRQTAYNYRDAWLRFGDSGPLLEQFTLEAVYALSKDDVPEKACDKALALAKKGERINKDKAKELIEAATPEPEPSPEPEEPEEDVVEAEAVWEPEITEDEPQDEEEGADSAECEENTDAGKPAESLSSDGKQSVRTAFNELKKAWGKLHDRYEEAAELKPHDNVRRIKDLLVAINERVVEWEKAKC